MRTILTTWQGLLGLALIVTAAVVGLGTASADASRGPIPGHTYKDVCKNLAGHQPIYLTTGPAAPFRFKTETHRRWDCEQVRAIAGPWSGPTAPTPTR